MKQILKHPITAHATATSITVYQAFADTIGKRAAAEGRLDVEGFSQSRMTWIKPSFLWMMYRAGWGQKDDRQSTILRITLGKQTFRALLDNACLSSFDPGLYPDQGAWNADLQARPNRVQWDPDKDMHLRPMTRRAIQIGISAQYVPTYLRGIERIEDITQHAQDIQALIASSGGQLAQARLPRETALSPDDFDIDETMT